ncbi:MAG: arylesterase [Pseudomonadota bacterium]
MKSDLRKSLVAIGLIFLASCSASEPEAKVGTDGKATVESFHEGPPEFIEPQTALASDTYTIVMLGDSLTAGFGLPPSAALPAEIERALRPVDNAVEVINAGVSGDTSAGGLARYDWSVASANPNLLVIALGANDYLSGIDPDRTRANLTAIIERALADDVDILLVSLSARSSTASDPRAAAFTEIYPDLAQTYEIALYSGLMDLIVDQPSLLMQDGLHPTADGVRIIAPPLAESVAEFLKKG